MEEDTVLCCRRGVDFSMASVRARSASTRERTWSRSEDDIIFMWCLLFLFCAVTIYFFVSFFLDEQRTTDAAFVSQCTYVDCSQISTRSSITVNAMNSLGLALKGRMQSNAVVKSGQRGELIS
mmetsp:Transcript_8460/g.13957  ORF Transcript_8460/g.13957 Transcript_8460/m.13957 type:complete len:123 (+) Transcript_8460:664-1032(+)